jgi:acyl carrier protein
MEIKDKILKIISDVCETEVNNITENSSVGDFPLWDSLGHLKILSAVEIAFDINFEPEEMMDIEDVKDIINAIHSKIE